MANSGVTQVPDLLRVRYPGRSTKIALGPNANAVLSLDLIAGGGAGNQRDDGVTSGTVSGQGTKIAVEVFAKGVTTSLVGVRIEFDFDTSVLKFDKAENSAFIFIIPEGDGCKPRSDCACYTAGVRFYWTCRVFYRGGCNE